MNYFCSLRGLPRLTHPDSTEGGHLPPVTPPLVVCPARAPEPRGGPPVHPRLGPASSLSPRTLLLAGVYFRSLTRIALT